MQMALLYSKQFPWTFAMACTCAHWWTRVQLCYQLLPELTADLKLGLSLAQYKALYTGLEKQSITAVSLQAQQGTEPLLFLMTADYKLEVQSCIRTGTVHCTGVYSTGAQSGSLFSHTSTGTACCIGLCSEG